MIFKTATFGAVIYRSFSAFVRAVRCYLFLANSQKPIKKDIRYPARIKFIQAGIPQPINDKLYNQL
jgi:hypothetical protein